MVEDVLAIHAGLIERFGGAQGERGPGLLEATLHESLLQNQPFINGNKRPAFALPYVFLAINEVEITAPDEVATREIMAL